MFLRDLEAVGQVKDDGVDHVRLAALNHALLTKQLTETPGPETHVVSMGAWVDLDL